MHANLHRGCRIMAWLGGAALLGLITLTCLSILGRGLADVLHDAPFAGWLLDLGLGGITGDYEVVEAGIAFAIFAFLPICQIEEAHAKVDIFTARLPARAERQLRALIALLFAAVLILIAVQLFAGMTGKRASGQHSFLLEFPIWWGYAACLPGAALASFVASYQAVLRVAEAATGRDFLSGTGLSR